MSLLLLFSFYCFFYTAKVCNCQKTDVAKSTFVVTKNNDSAGGCMALSIGNAEKHIINDEAKETAEK
jgi:hypothetical protein